VLLSLVPAHDQPGFAVSPKPGSRDAVGDLIRRNDEDARSASPVRHRHLKGEKHYGARDRRALDRLIEATGNRK
jgi:hypothetical protein